MKVSRARAEANRERVIAESSRLFREKGFAAVGLNALMRAAGLTRGGFYGQFESKQDLVRLALGHAMKGRRERWEAMRADAGAHTLRRFVIRYLSDSHRDDPGAGCPLASLGADVGREDVAIKTEFEAGVREMAGRVSAMMPGETGTAREQQALGCLAALMGGLVLSRAVADPALSRDIRDATAATVLAAFERPGGDARPST
jgi:TetR/AcrR family transcriptional repressor of nem operon